MMDFTLVGRALALPDLQAGGRVTRVTGNTLEAILPRAQTGAIYRIQGSGRHPDLLAEVVGFRQQETILAPFGEPWGIGPGEPLLPEGLTDEQSVSDQFLGRVLDPLGRPLDQGPPVRGGHLLPLYRPPPNPLLRQPIHQPLITGVGVLDLMTLAGQGQRLGIFAGPGVGKSTLLGMVARYSQADVNVIALVGERGREVRSFIEGELGPAGMARSVVLVATGDQAPILRVRTAFFATTLAEYFRDRGKKVLLMMDSLTRLAHAAREIGLSAGEPPTTRGYPPSVFSLLPKLLERAGNAEGPGTMTAFYTVLVDGDDMTEPVADAAKGILDGHLLLSRRMAEAGRFPAVDVLGSLSRVAVELMSPAHLSVARRARALFSRHEELKDLLQVGAYRPGSDPGADRAIQLTPRIADYLRQERSERRSLESGLSALTAILGPEDHA